MPELEPTWNRLSELMGGGDAAARFLSMWCPPPYITGCTQAVAVRHNTLAALPRLAGLVPQA